MLAARVIVAIENPQDIIVRRYVSIPWIALTSAFASVHTVGHFEGQTQIGGHFLFLFSGLYLFILVCLASYLSETLACCLTSKPGKHSSVASFFPLGKKFHLASILSLQQPPIPDCATTISKTSPFSLLAAAAAAEEEEEEKEELVL